MKSCTKKKIAPLGWWLFGFRWPFFRYTRKMRSFSCAGVFWSLLGYFAFRSDSAKGAKVCPDPIPSPRCNVDSCLTHFPKTGCKARKPCGRISANMLAVELPLWLDIDNMFVVKPTLRSNNDNVLSAWLPLRLIMETCLQGDQPCGRISATCL